MRIPRFLRAGPIPRAEGVSRRVVTLSLGGRFTDEVLSGLPDVLMPTLQRTLGLRYSQVGVLALVLNYVASVVEPANGLLIDLWQRRWLMAWGAAVVGLAVIVMGLATSFFVLVLGFALYGLGSGPLAHTADAVLVEAHPSAPARIFARATSLDTIGAMLAPLLVAATLWGGLDWRWLLVGLGLGAFVYAALLASTNFPAPANREQAEASVWRTARTNLRLVLSSREAIAWLAFLLLHELFEAPLVLETIWLSEVVGLGQAQVGLYRALEMAIALAGLAWLDRWLVRATARRVLLIAIGALLVLYPSWVLVPGVWPRVALAVPLNFLGAAIWPVAKARSLTSVTGRPGTVTAVSSLFGFVPMALGVSLLAEATSLTTAMLVVPVVALALMALLAWAMPRVVRPPDEA
jgi:MFS family permease